MSVSSMIITCDVLKDSCIVYWWRRAFIWIVRGCSDCCLLVLFLSSYSFTLYPVLCDVAMFVINIFNNEVSGNSGKRSHFGLVLLFKMRKTHGVIFVKVTFDTHLSRAFIRTSDTNAACASTVFSAKRMSYYFVQWNQKKTPGLPSFVRT